MNSPIRCIKYVIGVQFLAQLRARFVTFISKCFSSVRSITGNLLYYLSFQHDANAVLCDSELSKLLKSAAYSAVSRMTGEIQDDVPVLMSGAGHDAMAMSHLTKVC